MKKLLSIAILSLFLNSCDDGDIVFKEPNFENNNIENCTGKSLYYKINAKDMMILKDNSEVLSESKFAIGVATPVLIGASTLELISRTYDEVVTSKSICDALPPVDPKVIKEITANAGGTVLVTRDFRIIDENTLDSPTTIKYYFNIRFQNISFKDGENDINQTDFSFGEYNYKTGVLSFTFPNRVLYQCQMEDKNRLVVNTGSEAMVLNVPDGVLENTEKNSSFELSETNNLIYKVFRTDDGIIDRDKACSDETAFGKTIQIENWNAAAGTLKVVSTKVVQPENAPVPKTEFLHKLTFEKVTFSKEGRSFVKETFDFGEITTELTN